jgi:hypothetical protein
MFLTIATLIKVFDVRPWTSEKDGVKAEIGEDRPPGMDMPRYVVAKFVTIR